MKVLSYLLLTAMIFTTTGCLNQNDGQYIPGVNGPKVNIQDGKVLLTIELENVGADIGATLPIADLPNSQVTVGPSISDDGTRNGTMIRVAFDPKDVENDDFRVVPNETLPDGRLFPFTVDGTLPALAFHVPKAKDTTFYVSEKLFGFFLPISLPDNFDISVHYRIKVNGKNYGIVSLIQPNATGEGAGVVVLLTLDDIRNNPEAQKLLKLSKRNKSRVY